MATAPNGGANDDEIPPRTDPASVAAGQLAKPRVPFAYTQLFTLLPEGSAEAMVKHLDALDDTYPLGPAKLVVTIERSDGSWRFVRFQPEPPEEVLVRRGGASNRR